MYEKYLEFDSSNSTTWISYAQLESQLADYARTRGIFELGVSQAALSMPEVLWKAYIDFEVEEGERENARSLYERLISLRHVFDFPLDWHSGSCCFSQWSCQSLDIICFIRSGTHCPSQSRTRRRRRGTSLRLYRHSIDPTVALVGRRR